MVDNDDAEPTQRTDKGLEIPVPERDEFFKNLEKVAPKVEQDDENGPDPD